MRSHVWLLIYGISYRVWSCRLDHDALMVGRHHSCDIQLTDNSVSRIHARIERRRGKWHIIDLESMNGTYLNGVRIQVAEIHVGDHLTIGGLELIVVPGTADAPAPEFDAVEVQTPNVRNLNSAAGPTMNGQLTEKQTEVLQLLKAGLSEKEVAVKLDMSVHTAHTHIQHIYAVFDAHSRARLIARLYGDGRK